MIQGSIPCFSSTTEAEVMHQPNQLYQDLMEASYDDGGGSAVGLETQLRSILCSLTVLKQKVDEVESLVSMFLSQESQQEVEPFASIATIIQEIVLNSSSMMFNFQQMTIGSSQTGTNNCNEMYQVDAENSHHNKIQKTNNQSNFIGSGVGKMNINQGFLGEVSFFNLYDNGNGNNNTPTTCNNYLSLSSSDNLRTIASTKRENFKGKDSRKSQLQETYDLVEPEAADLLAKYTHYCHVCGKGFKRDANLRMHMRAHGDEYKSRAALSNPLKESGSENREKKPPRKYSCPEQGCRWNKNHAKFQPLKSIVCVKNHYRRSHCPKMYVCKRCNKKQFSVLSDLRTHEKHCGDRKWQCSCGTTFSRKDKLMGHVNLFVGHTPIDIITQLGDNTKPDNHGGLHIQFESSR